MRDLEVLAVLWLLRSHLCALTSASNPLCFSLYSALVPRLCTRAAVLVHGCYLQADLRLARTADRPRSL
jgi:hypothetical protein